MSWFEEPVTSDDLAGLSRVRDGAPAGVEAAAGEYGYDVAYFCCMLEAAPLCCALARARHVEYFHNHARMKRADAERFRVA